MFIDFHTHIFPDKVAAKAIPKLAETIHQKPETDGTYSGLQKSMDDAGIAVSVVLPPVTAVRQFESINRFAAEINEEFFKHPDHGILSFGGIHPDSGNYKEQLKELKAMGFIGIKLHPDYQEMMFNDIRYKRLIDKASELDFIVVTHTGNDPYSPDVVHCTVPMIVDVLEDVAPPRLVLAHMGNNMYYDEVEAELIGRDVYLDTAYSISTVEPARLLRMIRNHGADKVLFATDVPWSPQKDDVITLKKLGLTEEELNLVSHQNALKLLQL